MDEIGVDVAVEEEEIPVDATSDVIKGDKGDKGEKGDTGEQGISITSVEQIQTSSEDEGTNIVRVTLSNGNTSDFTIKNGSKGSKGDTGEQGEPGEVTLQQLNEGLSTKVDKETGKGLSTNDYTTAEKNKLANLENYDDTEIQNSLSNKVDKVTGKGLSTNDYDNTEKAQVATNASNISALQNAGFITNTVNNLTNYYAKSDTYTKQEVNSLIAQVPGFKVEVVQTLPVQDIDTDTIYLVPNTQQAQDNVYDEYLYINNNWEMIGSTAVDLTDYYNKTQIDGMVEDLEEMVVVGDDTDATSNTLLLIEPNDFNAREEGEIYSTDEVRVGTWIDGKPLYRKVIQNTVPTTSANGTIAYKDIVFGYNCGVLIFESGFVINPETNSSLFIPLQSVNGINQFFKIFVLNNNSGLSLQNSMTSQNGRNFIASFLYTKTTD